MNRNKHKIKCSVSTRCESVAWVQFPILAGVQRQLKQFLFSQRWKQWPAFIIIFVVTTDWWWMVLAYYSANLNLSSFRAEFQFYWHLSHQFSLRKTNKTNFILHESWWILRNTTICLAVSMWKTKQCTHMSTIGKSLRCLLPCMF